MFDTVNLDNYGNIYTNFILLTCGTFLKLWQYFTQILSY